MPARAGRGGHSRLVARSIDLCGKCKWQACGPLSVLLPLNLSSSWKDSDTAGSNQQVDPSLPELDMENEAGSVKSWDHTELSGITHENVRRLGFFCPQHMQNGLCWFHSPLLPCAPHLPSLVSLPSLASPSLTAREVPTICTSSTLHLPVHLSVYLIKSWWWSVCCFLSATSSHTQALPTALGHSHSLAL